MRGRKKEEEREREREREKGRQGREKEFEGRKKKRKTSLHYAKVTHKMATTTHPRPGNHGRPEKKKIPGYARENTTSGRSQPSSRRKKLELKSLPA